MRDVSRLEILTFYTVTLNLLLRRERTQLGQPFVLRGSTEAGLHSGCPALASLLPSAHRTPVKLAGIDVPSSRQAALPGMHGTDCRSEKQLRASRPIAADSAGVLRRG